MTRRDENLDPGKQPIGTRLYWGAKWGVRFGLTFIAYAAVIFILRGSASAEGRVPSFAGVATIYLFGGIAAGSIVGMLLPLTRWALGAAAVGVIAAVPVLHFRAACEGRVRRLGDRGYGRNSVSLVTCRSPYGHHLSQNFRAPRRAISSLMEQLDAGGTSRLTTSGNFLHRRVAPWSIRRAGEDTPVGSPEQRRVGREKAAELVEVSFEVPPRRRSRRRLRDEGDRE